MRGGATTVTPKASASVCTSNAVRPRSPATDLIHSPDDATRFGLPYYAEVIDGGTFETLHTTELYATPREARKAACEWCEQNLGMGQ